jgi:hypothetical protein
VQDPHSYCILDPETGEVLDKRVPRAKGASDTDDLLKWLDNFLRDHPEKGSIVQLQAELDVSNSEHVEESDDGSDPGEPVPVMLEFPGEKGQGVKRVKVEVGNNEKVRVLYKKVQSLVNKRPNEFKLAFHATGKLVELADQSQRIEDVKCANCLLRVLPV